MRKTRVIVIVIIGIITTFGIIACGRSGIDETTDNPVLEISNTPTQQAATTTPVETAISPTIMITNTPERTVDDEMIKKIRQIQEHPIICEVDKNDPDSITFSAIDFSEYAIDEEIDLRTKIFEYKRPEDVDLILNFQLYSNNHSILYDSIQYYGVRKSIFFDIDTEEIEILYDDPGVGGTKISPNEERIMYRGWDGNLYVKGMDTYGSEFAAGVYFQSRSVFSPDSEYIAFVGKKSSSGMQVYAISVHNADDLIQLTTKELQENDGATYRYQIAWSMDSENVIFFREIEFEKTEICKVNIFSLQETCYGPPDLSYIYAPSLSEDEDLLFSAMVGGFNCRNVEPDCTNENMLKEIYVHNMETGDLLQITDTIFPAEFPIWIDDGEFILYGEYYYQTWQVFITDRDGSFSQQITFSDKDSYPYPHCPSLDRLRNH
jgi:hypothetical protein